MDLSLKLINKQVSRKVQRLELFRLSVNGKLVDVWDPILCVNGRTFICADYCDNLGGRMGRRQIERAMLLPSSGGYP